MKYCQNCKVSVSGTTSTCPLCQHKLNTNDTPTQDTFPYIPTMYKEHSLFFRFLIFISVVVGVICVGINILIPTRIFWASFVVIGIICVWISLAVALKKLHNIPKNILYQVIIIGLLSVIWDKITGSHNWSLNYVIPFLCVGAIVSLAVLAWVMKFKLDDYIFYFLIYVIFGIIPIWFLTAKLVTVLYPSLISIGLSIVSLSALIIFKGEYIVLEIKNRFHI